jgi:protein-S-isoprenylcysteine O-methyltransferase Ste14
MTIDRCFDWLPLVVLVAMLTVARVRAWVLYRRGVRAIIVDWQRPARELIYDTVVVALGAFWLYLLVAEAWPLPLDWLPGWLTATVIDAMPAKIVGAALLLAAPILFVTALWSMGRSWRLGIDAKRPGPLVTAGLFAWMRNPMYVAFYLVIVGTMLVHGRTVFLLVGAALALLIHGVVLREERFLAREYGDAFRDYCGRVGRYGF